VAGPVTELQELALDPLVPQPWFSVASRSISPVITALAGGRPGSDRPASWRPGAVPPEHSAGRDQPVGSPLCWQEPDQRGEDRAVGPVQPGPRSDAARHRGLVPQCQQPGVLGGGRAAKQDKPAA
jgi:hypothetical protein